MADRRRKWPQIIRDLVLFAVAGLVVLSLAQNHSNQQANTKALCAFRADIEKRYDSTVQFIRTHPNGFAGISTATLNTAIANEAGTLLALKPLMC